MLQERTLCLRSGQHGHRRYETRKRARTAMKFHVRMHREGMKPCFSCWRGLVPSVFRCMDAEVWHWGHSR